MTVKLSKSNFVAGVQCLKRLLLLVRPEPSDRQIPPLRISMAQAFFKSRIY